MKNERMKNGEWKPETGNFGYFGYFETSFK